MDSSNLFSHKHQPDAVSTASPGSVELPVFSDNAAEAPEPRTP
jgi:hypothetical protein